MDPFSKFVAQRRAAIGGIVQMAYSSAPQPGIAPAPPPAPYSPHPVVNQTNVDVLRALMAANLQQPTYAPAPRPAAQPAPIAPPVFASPPNAPAYGSVPQTSVDPFAGMTPTAGMGAGPASLATTGSNVGTPLPVAAPVPSGPPSLSPYDLASIRDAAVRAAYANAPATPDVPVLTGVDPYSASQQAAFAAGTWKPVLTGADAAKAASDAGAGAATGFGGMLNAGVPMPENPVTWSPNKIGMVDQGPQFGSDPVTGAVVSAVSAPIDKAKEAAAWGVQHGFGYIDKPRQISTTQMGELIYQAANGDGTMPPILAALGAPGQQLWTAMTEQARKDKGTINQLYNQGAAMGGANVFDPNTGQMTHSGGEHIDGGRAVYEKYFQGNVDTWSPFLKYPFRILFDVVADPVTYALPGVSKAGEGLIEAGGALRAGQAAERLTSGAADIGANVARDAAATAAKDAVPVVAPIADAGLATDATAGAADIGAAVPPVPAPAPAPTSAIGSARVGPISGAEPSVVEVASAAKASADKAAATWAALNPADKAATEAAAREVLKTTGGIVMQVAGHILAGPQEVLDAVARIAINGPINVFKAILGPLAEASQTTIKRRVIDAAAQSGRDVFNSEKFQELIRLWGGEKTAPAGTGAITADELGQAGRDYRKSMVKDMDTGAATSGGGVGPTNPQPPHRWTLQDVRDENPGMNGQQAQLEANRRNAAGERAAYDAATGGAPDVGGTSAATPTEPTPAAAVDTALTTAAAPESASGGKLIAKSTDGMYGIYETTDADGRTIYNTRALAGDHSIGVFGTKDEAFKSIQYPEATGTTSTTAATDLGPMRRDYATYNEYANARSEWLKKTGGGIYAGDAAPIVGETAAAPAEAAPFVPAVSGPVVAPEPPISVGAVPLENHLTPASLDAIKTAPLPVGDPAWYRDLTPEQRSALIKQGKITELTPYKNGDRIVDNAYRDYGLSGDPAKAAKWTNPEGTGFLDKYQTTAQQFTRDKVALDAQYFPNFTEKKVAEAVMEAEHVVHDVVPVYRETIGGMPDVAVTAERQPLVGGKKANYTAESEDFLVQRAVYSTDPASSEGAVKVLQERLNGSPGRDDLIRRIQQARAAFTESRQIERGAAVDYVAKKQTVYAVYADGTQEKVRGFQRVRDAEQFAAEQQATLAKPKDYGTFTPGTTAPDIAPPAPQTVPPPPSGIGIANLPNPDRITQGLDAFNQRAGSVIDGMTERRALPVVNDTLSIAARNDPTILGDMVRRSDITGDSFEMMNRTTAQGVRYFDAFDHFAAQAGFDEAKTVQSFANWVARVEGATVDRNAVAKFTRAFFNIPRGIMQYNWATGWRGVIGDYGDIFKMIFDGSGAQAVDRLSPVRLVKQLMHAADPLDEVLGKTGMVIPNLEPVVDRTGSALGEVTPTVGFIKKASFGRIKSGSKAERVVNILTEPVDSRVMRAVRQANDTIARRTVFLDTVQKELPQRARRWLDAASAQMQAAGIDPASFEQLPDLFSAQQAREAALAGGADTNLANRIARNWKEELNAAGKSAKKEVNRVLYSFETTRLDDNLSNFFFFHYYMSRSYPSYASMAIRNPEVLAIWYRVWKNTEKRAQAEGLPASYIGRIRYMGSMGGFASSFSPLYMILPMNPTDLFGPPTGANATWYDKVTRVLMPNPAVSVAASFAGLTNTPSDPLMSYSLRRTWGTYWNWARAHGYVGDKSQADAPYTQALINSENTVHGWLNWMHVPTGHRWLADDPNAYSKEVMAYVARDIIVKDTGVPFEQWTPKEWQLFGAANTAIKLQLSGNPTAEHAFLIYQNAMAGNAAAASVIPGGSKTAYGPRDTSRAIIDQAKADAKAAAAAGVTNYQPTVAQQNEKDFKKAAQATAGAAPLLEQAREYGDLGTKWSKALEYGWDDIAFGDAAALQKWGGNANAPANYIQIGGKWWSVADLTAPDNKVDRTALADQWVAERTNPDTQATGTADLAPLKAQEKSFKTANATYGQYADWKKGARKYPGGIQAWMDLTRKGNPNYDAFLSKETDPVKYATSVDAYLAWKGQAENIYADPTLPVRDMSGVPYSPTTDAAGGGSSTGAGPVKLSRPDALRKSEDTYTKTMTTIAPYLPKDDKGNPVDLGSLPPNIVSAYLDALKKRGISVPSLPSRVSTYYQWRSLQPTGSDTSEEAFFVWLDANQGSDAYGQGLTPAA